MIKMFKDYVKLDDALSTAPGDLYVKSDDGKVYYFPKSYYHTNEEPMKGYIVGVDLGDMKINPLDEGYYEIINQYFLIDELKLSTGEKRLLELVSYMSNAKVDVYTLHDRYHNPSWPDSSKYTWFLNRLDSWYYVANDSVSDDSMGFLSIHHDVFLDRIVPDISQREGFFRFMMTYDMDRLKLTTMRLHADMCEIVNSHDAIGGWASLELHAAVMLMEFAPTTEQSILSAVHKHYKGEYEFYPGFMVAISEIATKQLQVTGHDWDAISMYLRCNQEWILDLKMSSDY